MKLKTMLVVAAAVALTVGISSCGKTKGCMDPTSLNYNPDAQKDDGSCTYATPVATNTVVTGALTANTTWTKDKIYELQGKVVVNSGVTLTIEAGTLIKGQEGTGTNASALVVAKGGKISAIGTAAEPIIFTSVLDNIKKGEKTGTNLTESDNSKWGGVILLGNAPVSTANGDVVGQIEGIPATDAFGAYGGSSANDNSGILTYISIRHGGALIGEGNEINGLTLGGVGSGTTIHHIEIVATLDDGMEFFGGTVNISDALVAYQGDDGFDIDQNYSGTLSNIMVIQGISTDEAFEIDGPEGSTNTTGRFTINGALCKSADGIGSAADFKSDAQGTISNVKWIGYTGGATIKIRSSYQNDCATAKVDAFTHLTDATPTLIFNNNIEYGASAVYSNSTNTAGTSTCPVSSSDLSAAQAKIPASTTQAGTATTAFEGWTWTAVNNKF